jgi:formylglycine-generating enzyme required for sulfatase activity
MTQHAAATYCEWLSRKTGRNYRLPSEAEWEWACRAGTTTPHSCSGPLAEHAWFLDNSGGSYRQVGTKLPNPWGLHDMHGNVAEWTAEQYVPQRYAEPAPDARWPLRLPVKEYPIAVRGGSFLDGPLALRSAARRASHPDWKQRDPQIPKSIWYMTDARFVGFRVLREPER